MARYFLDTNIILGYLRSASYAAVVEKTFSPFSPPNIAAMSVVSRGELAALAYRNRWGAPKQTKLEELLKKIPQVDISNDAIVQMYGEIDAFSQGYHPTKSLTMSARNMGKNDIWIAATAAISNATLITTDKDFDHLHGIFLQVIYIDPSSKP